MTTALHIRVFLLDLYLDLVCFRTKIGFSGKTFGFNKDILKDIIKGRKNKSEKKKELDT